MHAHHRADLVDAVAAGVDHDLRADVALGRVHGPAVILMLGEAGDWRVAMHLGPPGLAGAPGQRLTQLRRVDVAVQRIPEPADQVTGLQKRMATYAFIRVDHLELNPPHAPPRHRGEVAIAVHLLRSVGQANAAGAMVVVDRIIGIVGQLLVEPDRMAFQPTMVWVMPKFVT